MNLGAMEALLARYAGVDTLTDPTEDWINAGMRMFEEAYDWPFMEAASSAPTVVGSSTIALPANFLKMANLKITAGPSGTMVRPALKYVSRNEWLQTTTYTATLDFGEPTHYSLIGNDLVDLFPIPDQIYTMLFDYEREEPVLSGAGNSPSFIPARYHYTIVEAAAVKALQAESEEGRADTAMDIFDASIDRHIQKLGGNKQTGSLGTVRDAMGYGNS